MGVSLEKVVLRGKGLCTYHWFKLVYGASFQCAGTPKMRKGFSLLIEKGGTVSLGRNVFFNNGCSITCRDEVSIGNDCMFGEGVCIYDHDHRFSSFGKLVSDQGYKSAPVSIGNNCWFGSNVVILRGTTVGNNCVVGAGSVLSGNIPDGSLCESNRELVITPIRFRDERD